MVIGALATLDGVLGTDLVGGFRLGIQVAPRVSTTLQGRFHVTLAAMAYGFGMRRRITITISGPGGPLQFLIPDRSGLEVLREVFVYQEYAVTPAHMPSHILDLGANIGASALFLRQRFPDARITAVEANPDFNSRSARKCAAARCRSSQRGGSQHHGTAIFQPSDESWGGTVTDEGAGICVPAVTLDELLSDDVDFVKLDIEGAEFDVLPSSNLLRITETIVGEIHASASSVESQRALALLPGHKITIVRPSPDGFTVFHAVRNVVSAR